MPKAYLFAEIDVFDPEVYETYRAGAGKTVLAHAGRYLVAGGDPEIAEGEGKTGIRTAILEFPTREALMAWYTSAEYREIREFRLRSAHTKVWIMTGTE